MHIKYLNAFFSESIKRPWDLIALSLLIMYYMGCFYYVPIFSQHLRLAPIISTIIQLENVSNYKLKISIKLKQINFLFTAKTCNERPLVYKVQCSKGNS